MNIGSKYGISETLHGIEQGLQEKYADIYILSSDSERDKALDKLQKEHPELKVQKQYELYCLLRREIESEKKTWDKLNAKRELTFSFSRHGAQEQRTLNALSTSVNSSGNCLERSPASDEGEKISSSKRARLS